MSRYHKKLDINHSEVPNHLGFQLGKLAGLDEKKCWILDSAVNDRYIRHPHFGDNPDGYFKRVIETFKHYKEYNDIYSYNLLNGFIKDGKLYNGLLGRDIMIFLLNGKFPYNSKYNKFVIH